MTHEETLSVLSVMRASYPAFYSKLTKRDLEGIVGIWTEMFADDDVGLVKFALKELITTHTGFPPDIAALKGKMKEITQAATGKPIAAELWSTFVRLINSGYVGDSKACKKIYDQMPRECQIFCGSPEAVAEYANMPSKELNTVVRALFLKQIENIEKRVDYDNRLPEGVKRYINALNKPIPKEDKLLSDEEFEDRRNQILAKLEEK